MSFARPPGGPRLACIDDFVSGAALAELRALAAAAATERDAAGERAELPVAGNPALARLFARVEAVFGAPSTRRATVRLRRYHPGDGHPPHLDAYRTDDDELQATAVLYLDDVAAGGETVFPAAELGIPPKAGRLLVFWTLDGDAIDPASRHASLPVVEGRKTVLLLFGYRRRRRAFFVHDGGPGETVAALAAAAEARGLRVTTVGPRDPVPVAAAGDLLYNAGTSGRALRIEQLLAAPGVAHGRVDPDGAFRPYRNGPLLLQRQGVPIPRTVFVPGADLEAEVASLGGFPVVVKLLGGSGGVGVLRADSMPALRSLLDLARAQGQDPLLVAWVGDAVHWRVIVVGDRVVAAWRNLPRAGDFRTRASTDPADHRPDAPPAAAAAARRACGALGLEMAGVDVLVHDSGRVYVLEANFPFYFGHAQAQGLDVAGAMLDHLLARARALGGGAPRPVDPGGEGPGARG